jgi:predicted transcriptional regulator
MKCHIETGKQPEGTTLGLTMTEKPNKETVEELREKQKQFQVVIDGLTRAEEANNRAIKEVHEKQKQLQATVDDLTKAVDEMNQMGKWTCGQLKDVST